MSSSYDIAFESFNWREIPGGVSAAEGLRGLLKANDRREVEAVYFDIENVAFVQGRLLPPAEATLCVLVASLADDISRHARTTVLDLIVLLLSSDVDSSALAETDLLKRCVERASEGLWLLTRDFEGEFKEAAIECVEAIRDAEARVRRREPDWRPSIASSIAEVSRRSG
jgi:hypothetical protein